MTTDTCDESSVPDAFPQVGSRPCPGDPNTGPDSTGEENRCRRSVRERLECRHDWESDTCESPVGITGYFGEQAPPKLPYLIEEEVLGGFSSTVGVKFPTMTRQGWSSR